MLNSLFKETLWTTW